MFFDPQDRVRELINCAGRRRRDPGRIRVGQAYRGKNTYPGGPICDRIGSSGVLLLCIIPVGDEQVPYNRESPTLVVKGETVECQHEPGDRFLHRPR